MAGACPLVLEEKTPGAAPGDPLEDRLQYGFAGPIAGRLLIALELARILQGWHRIGRFHGDLRPCHVRLDQHNHVTLTGTAPAGSFPTEGEDVRAFGRMLYQLLSGELLLSDPDIESLHKVGLPEQLVNLTASVMDGSWPGGLTAAIRVLEKEMEKLGAPATKERNVTWYAMLLLGSLALGSSVVWLLAHSGG